MRGWLNSQNAPPPGMAINPGSELGVGLVTCFTFGEGGGNLLNDSGPAGARGRLVNMEAGNPWMSVPSGGRLKTDGVDDRIDLDRGYTSASGTLDVLVAFPSAPGGNAIICSQNSSADANVGLGFQFFSGSLKFWVATGALDTTLNPTVGKVYRVTGTWSPAGRATYVDGLLTNTSATGTAPNLSAGFVMVIAAFTYSGGSLFFTALDLQSLMIWDRALTAPEVARLHAEPYAMFLPNRLARTSQSVTIFERRTLNPRVGSRGIPWN